MIKNGKTATEKLSKVKTNLKSKLNDLKSKVTRKLTGKDIRVKIKNSIKVNNKV